MPMWCQLSYPQHCLGMNISVAANFALKTPLSPTQQLNPNFVSYDPKFGRTKQIERLQFLSNDTSSVA
jgi:hypothetical protein